jgi:hypothetical protein
MLNIMNIKGRQDITGLTSLYDNRTSLDCLIMIMFIIAGQFLARYDYYKDVKKAAGDHWTDVILCRC